MTAIIDGLLDAEIIDEIGVSTIVDELGMTSSGVRNWRSRGIPDNRRDELLKLLARHRDGVAEDPTQGVSTPTHAVPSVSQTVTITTGHGSKS